MISPRIGFVLLAAGGSSRMGRPKQLIPVDGVPLIRRAALCGIEVGCSPAVVVLGSEANRVRTALDGLKVITVVNPRWVYGMSTSLQAGLETCLDADPDLAGLIVAVCDQPGLTASDLRSLAAAWNGEPDRAAAARYAGRPGVPAIFGHSWFTRLRELQGDAGARTLLRGSADTIATVDLPHLAEDWDHRDDIPLK